MLRDRSYMRYNPSGNNGGNDFAEGRKALFGVIAINAFVFLVLDVLFDRLQLTVDGIRNFELYRIVTAMFAHASLGHVFWNMFSLYIFGSLSAPILGQKRFLSLYFFAGIFGNLLWLASSWLSATPYRLIGASGAVSGVIMATAMLVPNVEMFLLFIPIPLRLRTLACVLVAIEVIQEISMANSSNIAYLVHIGGFAGAYLFMVLFLKNYVQWDPLKKLFQRLLGDSHAEEVKTPHSSGMPRGWSFSKPDGMGKSSGSGVRPVTQSELDYLLDKISRSGINSLSEQEMGRLEQARQQMRRDS